MPKKEMEKENLKARYNINIESRADKQKEIFTKWLNAQSNAQYSFMSLIEHFVDRFGYTDAMDHGTWKKMYEEYLFFNNQKVIIDKSDTNSPELSEEISKEDEIASSEKEETVEKPTEVEKKKQKVKGLNSEKDTEAFF